MAGINHSTWRGRTPDDAWRWLVKARDRQFRRMKSPGYAQHPAGSRFTIDGSLLRHEALFYCALGEAINGPGGYFGLSLISLTDCSAGGFGVQPPFHVDLVHSTQAARWLDHAEVLRWVERTRRSEMWRMEDCTLRRDIFAHVARIERKARLGRGPTMLDMLSEAVAVRGAQVHRL